MDAEILIVGAGHAGLSVAHHLTRARRAVLLVDAHARVGDAWRERWDSLELFTPRALNMLPGMPFPRGPLPFPGKDEVADYQEDYARAMDFALCLGTRVSALRRDGDGFTASLDGDIIRSRAAVVATGHFQHPRVPEFAAALDASMVQLHSSAYRRTSQLPEGPVVIVGAANSGAEIAVEVARERPVTLSVGKLLPRSPRHFRDPRWWRIAQLRGRLIGDRSLPLFLPWPFRPGPFTKVDLEAAARDHGLRVAERAVAAHGRCVRFADGTEVAARTVIWATGFRLDHSWIDAPQTGGVCALGRNGRGPLPGLWFIGARFLFPINFRTPRLAREIVRALDRG